MQGADRGQAKCVTGRALETCPLPRPVSQFLVTRKSWPARARLLNAAPLQLHGQTRRQHKPIPASRTRSHAPLVRLTTIPDHSTCSCAVPGFAGRSRNSHLANAAEHPPLVLRDGPEFAHGELENPALLLLALCLGAHEAQLTLRGDRLRLDLLQDLGSACSGYAAGDKEGRTLRRVSSERLDILLIDRGQ